MKTNFWHFLIQKNEFNVHSLTTKWKAACMSYLTQSEKSGFSLKEPSAKRSTHVFCSQNMFFKTDCQTSFRSRKLIHVFRTPPPQKKEQNKLGLNIYLKIYIYLLQSFELMLVICYKRNTGDEDKGIQFLVFQLAMQLKESHISINRNISVSFYFQYAIFLQTFQRRKKIVARIKKEKG